MNYDIVILTDKRYLKDSNTDDYKHNVFYEDFLVQEALKKLGLKTLRLAWDNSTIGAKQDLCYLERHGIILIGSMNSPYGWKKFPN